MAKIRNSSMKNWYGDGHQQIFTDDSGKEYIIRNSAMKEWYGDGHQKIVEEKGSQVTMPLWLLAILFGIGFIIQLIIKANM